MLLWYYMLSKRLFKKGTFLLLLCMIPLILAGMMFIATQESGMLTIAIYQENPKDELSSELIAQLMESRGVLKYEMVTDEREAYRLVESAKADAAWLFPDKMQERLDAYTMDAFTAEKLLTIVEREDNVALQLAREKLYGSMYAHISYSVYVNYIRSHFPGGEDIPEEELQTYYEDMGVEGSLFEFAYADGGRQEENAAEVNYLTSPLRGMLSLVVMLCGLAATMYYLQDEEKGVFDMIPLRGRSKYYYAYVLTAMFFAGVALLLAFAGSKILIHWGRESLCMILYILMCSVFCSVIRSLCKTITRLGAMIPPLMLLVLAICPIFFATNRLRPLQILFPPYLYLNSIHDMSLVVQMVLYCVAGFAAAQGLYWIRVRRS